MFKTEGRPQTESIPACANLNTLITYRIKDVAILTVFKGYL
jgi:hypothetical protein